MISIARSAAVAAKPKCTRLGWHRAAVPNAGAIPRPKRLRGKRIGCASQQRTFVLRTVASSQSVVPAAVVGIRLRSPLVAAAGKLAVRACSARRRVSHENSSFKLLVASLVCHAVLPNPSLERTSTGVAPRAVVVHHPSRGALPVASAQLKR